MQQSCDVLDIIVQSSTVDLFHSCGLAVAPLARSAPAAAVPHPALAAMIGFRAKGFTGTLTAGVPDQVFAIVPQNPERPFAGADWIREMANQLLGRVKGRLLQLGTSLKVGLPGLVNSDALARVRERSPFYAVYRFRTLRGEILVTLMGDIEPSVFVYTGAVVAANEGDVILF